MLVARYTTKKELKASIGGRLRYTETSIHCNEYSDNGNLFVVGPSAYVRKWYAKVKVQEGRIVQVW